MPRPRRLMNVFVDDNDPARQEFLQQLDPAVLNAICRELKIEVGKKVDEDYQKQREDELRNVNIEDYLKNTRLEAQKRFMFKEQCCVKCVRRGICNNIGTVVECSVYDKEDPEFNNSAILGRVRGV